MHRAETLIKTVDLSQTTNICTKYYLLYLPCSDIGIRQSPPYHDLNMEEKGNYEENLKLKTSTADCLLKDFCLAQRFILFYLKVLFSLSQRCLFNKFYPFFFFWSYNYISIVYWRLNPKSIFLSRHAISKDYFLSLDIAVFNHGSVFQQLFYVALHLLTGRVIVPNKLRPKLIANISLDVCRENPVPMYSHVCTSLDSKDRENNIVIPYSYYIVIKTLQLFLLLLIDDFRDAI